MAERCRAWTCTAYPDKLTGDRLGEPSKGETIQTPHLEEAIQHRPRRQF